MMTPDQIYALLLMLIAIMTPYVLIVLAARGVNWLTTPRHVRETFAGQPRAPLYTLNNWVLIAFAVVLASGAKEDYRRSQSISAPASSWSWSWGKPNALDGLTRTESGLYVPAKK